MKIHHLAAALALTAASHAAYAQKTYNEGLITIQTTLQGNPAEVKNYFSADSTASLIVMGPANIKMLADTKGTYMAVILDVPVANMKKAGVMTPAEVEAANDAGPKFTFTPTTETKQISGFNCKKVVAKDAKSGKSYDIWITNDVSTNPGPIPAYYRAIGGFPVKYFTFQQGQEAECTVTSVTDEKAPKGTYGIPSDFPKVGMDELMKQ